MKITLKATRRPPAKRICIVVEKLCYGLQNYPEGNDLKFAHSIIDEIYRYVHLQSACKNPHLDWRREFYKTEKELEKK